MQALAAVSTLILGIDPGALTGLSLVRVGPRAPYNLVKLASVADDDVVNWLRQLTQECAPDAIAIEDWEPQGAKRIRGVGYQGFAAGRCAGIAEAFGIKQIALVRRSEVLGGMGAKSEKGLHERVRMLTSIGERNVNAHELDATGVAIVGAGHLGPLYAGDRFNRTPRPRAPRRKR